jgi:hypothetical protein
MASASDPTKPIVDATNLSLEEKIEAVHAEAETKRIALRDTLAANEQLQRRIQSLHTAEEAAVQGIRAAQVDLDEAKKRQTLQRYYRRRAETDLNQRRSALSSLARANPALAQKVNAAAAKAGSSAAGPAIYDTQALEELRIIVADTVDRAEGFRAKRSRLEKALEAVTALRLKLESATSRQLRHTETLAGDVASKKKAVRVETAKSAREFTTQRKLHRDVAAMQRVVKELEGDVKDVTRQNTRLSKRIRESDRAVGTLQDVRGEAKNNAETEAESALRRDAAVDALRKENAAMIQWLLDDAPPIIDRSEQERIQREARQRAEAAAAEQKATEVILGLPRHDADPAATARQACARKKRDERVDRLFTDFEAAIRKARATIPR